MESRSIRCLANTRRRVGVVVRALERCIWASTLEFSGGTRVFIPSGEREVIESV